LGPRTITRHCVLLLRGAATLGDNCRRDSYKGEYGGEPFKSMASVVTPKPGSLVKRGKGGGGTPAGTGFQSKLKRTKKPQKSTKPWKKAKKRLRKNDEKWESLIRPGMTFWIWNETSARKRKQEDRG